MVLNSAQIIFTGVIGVVMLLACYGLFEWARIVLTRRAAGWSEKKSQLAFGIPATAVAFLPSALLSLAINLQPFGGEMVFDAKDVSVVYAFFVALLGGIAFELVALIAFAIKLNRAGHK